MRGSTCPDNSTASALSLSDSVYEQLEGAILSGAFGCGDELNEVSLASRLQVSRTPVREALRRLAAEGLVLTSRHQRSRVICFSAQEAIEVYQVRQFLEAGATRLAAERITAEQLRPLHTLAAASEPDSGKNWEKAAWQFDEALHATIAEASGNERLRKEIARIRRLVVLLRAKSLDSPRRALRRKEHLLILHALELHDPESAAAAMNRHIAASLQAVLEVMTP